MQDCKGTVQNKYKSLFVKSPVYAANRNKVLLVINHSFKRITSSNQTCR